MHLLSSPASCEPLRDHLPQPNQGTFLLAVGIRILHWVGGAFGVSPNGYLSFLQSELRTESDCGKAEELAAAGAVVHTLSRRTSGHSPPALG